MKKQLKTFKIKLFLWLSAALFILPLGIALPLNLIVFDQSFFTYPLIYLGALLLGYILIIAVHEGLHGLSAILLGVSPKKISFGMVKEQLMFYCHVSEPMSAEKYRFVLITPFVFLGIIPLIACTVWSSPFLVILFCCSISGCAGDLVMFFATFKYNKKQLIEDHPTAPAYYLIYKDDELPTDFVEVTKEQEDELFDMLHNKTKK